MNIKIHGTAPAGLSCRRPNGTWYRNPEIAKWDAAVAKATEGLTAPPYRYYAVTIAVPRVKGSFLSARVKQTLDALTRTGFWKDDRLVGSIVVKFAKSSENATSVTIREAQRKWR